MVRRKNTLPKGSFLHRRSRIHTFFSHIAHKRRNTRFNGLWRVHTPPHPLNAHTAAHRANGAGKRGAALRGTFETTKICVKRFQIRDREKPREQNNSRQTAAARQGRGDAVHRRRGSAEPRSPRCYTSLRTDASHGFFGHSNRTQRNISAVFTRRTVPCVLPRAAVPLLCPQHPSAADKTGRWKTGSAGSCRADFRFVCARPV